MNPAIGWALAAVFIALASWQYGWQGAVFAVTGCVFWLLLQFNRAVRVMKKASDAPMGRVDSAVMLHTRLRPGMPLMQVVGQAKSLGRRLSDDPERYEWADESGARVIVSVRDGRCTGWELRREDGEGMPPTPAP
jgi:hypothetical protein